MDHVSTQKQGAANDQWDKPIEEWDKEALVTTLNALKGGKKGAGKGTQCWNCLKTGHLARDCWSAPKGGKGGKNGEDGSKRKGKDADRALSQGYGGKPGGKGGGKKGWS